MLLLQVTAKISSIHPKDPEAAPCGVDDMTKLAYLHEPGVLQNLRSRYDMNEIYVSVDRKVKMISHLLTLPLVYIFLRIALSLYIMI